MDGISRGDDTHDGNDNPSTRIVRSVNESESKFNEFVRDSTERNLESVNQLQFSSPVGVLNATDLATLVVQNLELTTNLPIAPPPIPKFLVSNFSASNFKNIICDSIQSSVASFEGNIIDFVNNLYSESCVVRRNSTTLS